MAAWRDSNLLSITFQEPCREEIRKEKNQGGQEAVGGALSLDRERFYLLLRLIGLILVSSAAGEPLESSHTSDSS